MSHAKLVYRFEMLVHGCKTKVLSLYIKGFIAIYNVTYSNLWLWLVKSNGLEITLGLCHLVKPESVLRMKEKEVRRILQRKHRLSKV